MAESTRSATRTSSGGSTRTERAPHTPCLSRPSPSPARAHTNTADAWSGARSRKLCSSARQVHAPCGCVCGFNVTSFQSLFPVDWTVTGRPGMVRLCQWFSTRHCTSVRRTEGQQRLPNVTQPSRESANSYASDRASRSWSGSDASGMPPPAMAVAFQAVNSPDHPLAEGTLRPSAGLPHPGGGPAINR